MGIFQQLSFMENAELKKIGSKFKKLRIEKGYKSHETFAFDHEIPRMQYWRVEKGIANLTIKSIVKLLKIHNLTLSEFFKDIK